jgi:hypothetical protein
MKKILLFASTLLLLVAGTMFVASCSSDDDEPQVDELWQKVLNNNLPEQLITKNDLPAWIVERIDAAEKANQEGSSILIIVYQFQWKGQPYYMIRGTYDTGWESTVYTASGSKEIVSKDDLYSSSRDWKIVYRVGETN